MPVTEGIPLPKAVSVSPRCFLKCGIFLLLGENENREIEQSGEKEKSLNKWEKPHGYLKIVKKLNMKKLWTLLLIMLITMGVNAQKYKIKKEKEINEVIKELPIEGNQVVFEEAFSIDSLSKDIIFDRLREWNVGAFMDYKRSIKIDDKPTGIIVSQMVSRVYKRAAIISFSGQVSFTVSLVAKDGKYNCKLSDFHLITNNDQVKSYNDLFIGAVKYNFSKSELAIIKETGDICNAVARSIHDKVSARSATEF